MRICCCGEVMLEMATTGQDGLYRRGVAGDSFNTAVYLARAGLEVSYLTRLGDDSGSDRIMAQLAAEGIDASPIARCPGRVPGLYLIDNDSSGERYFSYWRDNTPARDLFASPPALPRCDAFYFTGITLAVTRTGFANLLLTLQALKQRGCLIIFDPNYRPHLWDSAQQAADHYRQVLPLCDIALPTLADERELNGCSSARQCLQNYQQFGVKEVIIKGDQLTTVACRDREQLTLQAAAVTAIDTTGAGDAYNAGYLAIRLRGGDLQAAVEHAQQLSAMVVQHRGAILPAQ